MEKDKKKRICPKCRLPETTFRKIYFEIIRGQRTPVKPNNDFIICATEGCNRAIPIKLHTVVLDEYDREEFVWYRADNFFAVDKNSTVFL